MKASPLPRRTARISDSLHRQLNMYTLAAGAAGVGTLCFAKPAEARIVYTPAHVAIKANGGVFQFDLNHDGTPDFGLSNMWYQGEKSYRTLRVLQSRPANEVLMIQSKACAFTTQWVAAALPKGKRIGPKGTFKSYPHGEWMAVVGGSATCGVWQGQSNLQAYLGLKFVIKGKIHFGWARVKVDTDRNQRPYLATLTGYAYETIPDKPIIAGATKGPDAVPEQRNTEPASLGSLARGRE